MSELDPQALAEACAEQMYADDKASQGLGITLESISPGRAEARMTVVESMVNGHDICHGGYIFTLADSTFAFACNTNGYVTVASSAKIEFLRPAKLGDVLTANGVEVYRGRKTGFYDVNVVNRAGHLIALFRGRSAQLEQRSLEAD